MQLLLLNDKFFNEIIYMKSFLVLSVQEHFLANALKDKHQIDYRLLNLDKIYLGTVSLKRLPFTPGVLTPVQVNFRLENERYFKASLYKKHKLRVKTNLTSHFRWPAWAWPLLAFLSTIIAVPVAIGIQAGKIACGLPANGGKLFGWKLQAKAKKHDHIGVLYESKLNKVADHILVALNDDKISDEEFRLILSETDKYKQKKEEIRDQQQQTDTAREGRDHQFSTKLLDHQPGKTPKSN